MSTFGAIDISSLPAPNFISAIEYAQILDEAKDEMVRLYPEAVEVLGLESEPMVKVLQVLAYREILIRQDKNDQARAVSLPFAQGPDLDVVASRHNVKRKTLVPGRPDLVPPVAPVMESDEELRHRAQLAFEGLADAGPEGAYLSVVTGVEGVRDADAIGPDNPRNSGSVANAVRPGEVLVVVLGQVGDNASKDGTASDALIENVRTKVMDSNIRTITHKVIVQSASIRHYAVRATLIFRPGPDRVLVMEEARRRVQTYVQEAHAVGQSLRLSALYAALHLKGVDSVILDDPGADILVSSHEAPFCTGIELVDGGVNG